VHKNDCVSPSSGSGFENVWSAITQLQGEPFSQKMGRRFYYSVSGSVLRPTTTSRNLPRSQFERAYRRLPVSGPSDLQDLQGPSYLFAILTDSRVRAIGSAVGSVDTGFH
jgi:hypothetical protein